jgi:predicted N-acetyltransferase YhbS
LINNFKLRNETALDYRSVEELTREAFWNHHVPGCIEHYLLHIMRNCGAFIRKLDFVAEIDGKVVANIVYTKSKIIGDGGEHCEVITFGPLSVLPDYQGKGIGGMLIKQTKEIAIELGYKAILIYGDPEYYRKFSFVEAEKYNIRTSNNMYAVPLQALELSPGALLDCAGCFFEDSVFEIDEKAAEEFDSTFPKKDKQNGLPSQERFIQLVNLRKPRQ